MDRKTLAQSKDQDLGYWHDSRLSDLAEEVIKEMKLPLNGCVMDFVWCDKPKKKNHVLVFADTHKVPDKFKALCHIDFLIIFYEPNAGQMTDEQLKILMYHELLHVGYDDGVCSIIPHDIEDFEVIIQKYGLHWAEVAHG